ncbi:Aminoglycoside phosphotransferase [Candidatus Methylobacter favarea]|uniref:Aminoglycoside phosphotransferase n=1 Tax=Candidatus Methylobacter favarea TaxID=2707345 RepID=A0A8S0WLN4_9GAMM|nr:aminoglycoside phosphotransferase family protein [Candidatus Methylobacter favarea]CAA9892740.1 Aminoglycoside phosphotransferase [Candidatus Methylobacter favarea]
MNPLFLIARRFAATVKQIIPLGNGLINDTYLVTTASSPFVLQRINRRVFPEPEHIMANLIRLNQHIEQKISGSVRLKVPEILLTTAKNPYFQDEKGDYWRALSFIADTESLETLAHISQAEQAGFALGHFHRLVSDLNPNALYDTLPGFHITPDYLNHYHGVLNQRQTQSGSTENRYCADFIASFQSMADDLEHAKRQGLLPVRIIHGDPKLNNFLFDKHSKHIVSLIDLDTVNPGLVHYDIADCLRSCCHKPETDEFDLDIGAAILKSYLSEAGAFFSDYDYRYLYPAIRLIPFELGLRFYTDYLQGNRYFKVTGPEQNLQRAAGQFRLCESIMRQEPAINRLLQRLHSQPIK